MATQNTQRDGSQQPNLKQNEQQENQNNRSAQATATNPDDQSVSTAGDTSDPKGSHTNLRKEEKEANDNFDHGRQS